MSMIINPYALGVANFVQFHAIDYGITTSGHTAFGDTLSIGAEPTGNNRRFVFLLAGGNDDSAQYMEYTSIPIAGVNGTAVTRSGDRKSFTSICYREVSSGTTAYCVTDYVGVSPTIGNAFLIAVTILTGADGFTIVDSGSADDGSTSLTVSTTLTGMGDGHAILAVGSMREGNSSIPVGVTERLDTGTSSQVITCGYDFGKAADTSQSVGFNPASSTSIGISAVAIQPA